MTDGNVAATNTLDGDAHSGGPGVTARAATDRRPMGTRAVDPRTMARPRPPAEPGDHRNTETARSDTQVSSKGRGWGIAGAVVVLVAVAGAASWKMGWLPGGMAGGGELKSADVLSTKATSSTAVIAVVDGRSLYEADIAPLLQQGVDRAVVVDRLINRLVIADAGAKDYPAETKAALDSMRAEAEANIWLNKRSAELKQKVTDQDIADWYAREVRDDLYRQVKLRYYLTQNPEDAKQVAESIKNNDKASLAKFQPFATTDPEKNKEPEKGKELENQYVPLVALPYGLGRTLVDAKAGFKSEPIMVRNGWFVFWVEDVRQQEKPTLEAMKDRIVEAIVSEKLNAQIAERRKAARIELKG